MTTHPRILSRGIVTLLAAAAFGSSARAEVWNADAADNWSVATRWTPNTVPNAVSAIADFSTINITANRTVTIDTTSRTVGTLIFADATTASNDWTLAASGGATLTMDLDGATAPGVIQVLNRTATITAPLLGIDGINVTGAATGASGTLVLNAANTFSGGLTISGAIVQLNNASAAGTNTITVAAGTNTASANKLAINGGLTIANNIVINALASPLAGQGAVQAVGTGQATVNGTITINGNTANGGHFVGGTAAGNELVLNGAITAAAGIQVVQRDGRVIYKSGGTGYSSLGVTGTAIVGANDGIATTAVVQLAVSNPATLDLGTFNQALAGVTFSATATGTVTGGTGVLTLNGAVNSSGNFTHVFNGNANLGGAVRNFTIGDGSNAIDLQAGAAFSNGTLSKLGSGTLALSGTSSAAITIGAGTLALNGTSSGPVTANAGILGGTGTVNALTTINAGAILSPGTNVTAGTFTTDSLTFGTGSSSLTMNVGTGNDLINVSALNGLTTSGAATLKILALGGPLSVGTTTLINHSGPIQGSGLNGFTLSGIGHATATLQDTGTAVRLNVTQATDTILWTGATNNTWDTTAANQNWKFQTGGAATSYLEGDDVRFADLTVPAPTTVNVAAPVNPSRVTIDNTAANPYTFTGATITGPTALTKTGAGTVVFQNILSYIGATTISAGTLEMDFDTGGFSEAGTGALGTSGISIAAGGTLRLTRDDADFTFDRSVSGAGTVLIDPHTAAGTASRTVTISGNNSGFSGTWKLSPSNLGAAGLGSFRTQNTSTNQTTLGTAAVDVDPGGQLWMADNTTLTNAITITGTGFAEPAGGTPVGLGALTNGAYVGTGTPPLAYAGIGAIRMGTGDTISGNVVVDGNSKIMAFGQTGTISGNISSTSATDTLVIGGGTSATTIILTGTNTYGKTFINGGSGTSNVIQTLQIGNGGTTGTLGSGEVVVYGNSVATGRLVFQRGDAYSFPASQNIIGAAAVTADLARTAVVVNNTGPGLTLNNNTIDLSDGTNGGTISVAGAGNTIGVNNSVLNISGSTMVDVGQFFVGDANGFSGTVTQAGTSTVNFIGQMRLGHWPNETGTYNLNGGSLNALGTPTQFPYATTETNGGIYVGIDGAANLVQSGGVISTNFIVLDNRADTGAGAGMANGFDTFTLNAGGRVVLNNAFGIISRNFTTAINLNGGTIQAAAGISPALDTNKIVVQSGGVTLDTNGANTFTLYGPLAGTGTVSLTNTGAGTGILNLANGGAGANNTVGGTMPGGSLGSASINLAANTSLQATRTTGVDTWSGNIAGSGALLKQGAGTLILTGSGSTFTGTTTVSGGRLDLPATFASPTISVADGAALGGEPTVASVTLGSATGGGLFINPATAASLTATNLTLNGTTLVDFSAPAASTTAAIPVISYTNLTGAPTFALANAANYRSALFSNAAGTVSLSLATKDLTWTGTGGAAWDVNTTTNFNDTTPAPDKFFFGDRVTFGDGPTQTAVTVTSGVSPWKTTVNSATNNYTFTSTTNGIAGPGNLEKSGASTLTLVGPNTYSGKTAVSGGTLASATLATSLGNAAATNTIELSGGSRLSDTGAVAFDFGPTRSITVGTGGGSISHNNATGANITISGKLIGGAADTLSFHSAAAGAGTFILAGDNSGYTGKITVDAQAAGITVLRLATQSSVPGGGSITLNFPAAGANGNATTLDLTGVSMPAAVGLNLTSSLNGTTSLRTQVTGNGENSIAGPITISGNAGGIVQFNLGSGNLTLTGNISESAPGSFGTAAVPGTVFFRGAGNTTINSTINLPTAHVIRVDNTGITTINSTGNNWLGTEVRSASTLRIGVNNALPTSTVLLIGQSTDAGNSFFDLNGFNQQIGGLNYIAGNGANTRGIINGSATQSTLTINVSGTNSFIYGNGGGTNPAGNITGNIAIVKEGSGTQTLSGATDTYTGNVTVNGGTLIAGGNAASTALGNPTIAGRSVTVNNSGSTVSFTTNNVFGNGVGNANLPSTILNSGTTLTSTRYNVLGPVTLNGATLTQSATDSGAYEGFQFKGTVTVGGSGASLISTGNGKANHLDSNTVFNVSDATGSSAVDLLVSTPLRNQSGDFGTAVGGLTKNGAGTMELSGTNTYTGATVVNAGVLIVSGGIGGSATTVNAGGTLAGSGTVGVLNVVGGILAPGSSPGTLTTGALTLDSASLLKFELAVAGTAGGGVNDLISVGGALTLDGTLQVAELPGFSTGTYRLFDYTGTLTNNILNLEAGFLAAHPGSSVNTATPGQVNLTVVPEPGALMSVVGGFGMLLGLRRLRRTV